jgi:hypothetical protein
MERSEQPKETPTENTEDERAPRDEEDRKPGEADREEASDKAPMKPGSAGAASRGSGPARTGS